MSARRNYSSFPCCSLLSVRSLFFCAQSYHEDNRKITFRRFKSLNLTVSLTKHNLNWKLILDKTEPQELFPITLLHLILLHWNLLFPSEISASQTFICSLWRFHELWFFFPINLRREPTEPYFIGEDCAIYCAMKKKLKPSGSILLFSLPFVPSLSPSPPSAGVSTHFYPSLKTRQHSKNKNKIKTLSTSTRTLHSSGDDDDDEKKNA